MMFPRMILLLDATLLGESEGQLQYDLVSLVLSHGDIQHEVLEIHFLKRWT